MPRSVPQIISLVAVLIGAALFVTTLLMVDRDATMRTAARLGLALPLVLLPSAIWHALRTLGWYICFPPHARPGYWRIFRVRLTADGVAYFTIRGLASEPLRVLLLMDRVPATVSAAATVLERTAMGILSVTLVGIVSLVAMSSEHAPPEWQRIFGYLAGVAALILTLTLILLARSGRYLAPLFAALHRWTGWRWTTGRVVRFVAEVEALSLNLARTDRWRLRLLAAISVVCYALMMLEVWVVFWAIGEPISLAASAFVETFTRSASVVGGVIPANLGALEASNVAVAKGLGAASAGSLALARRVRSLLWAGLGLALYPRAARRPQQEPFSA